MSGLLAAALILSASAQTSVSFTLDFPGQQPPHYTVTVNADGSGNYLQPDAEALQFHIAPASAARWMAAGRACSTGGITELQKVAYTGQKTVVVRDGNETKSFTWFSPKEDSAVDFTRMADALAETLQFGQVFARDRRYDRMQLDRDMQNLQHMLKTGGASNPEAIAPTLQSLADDPQVLSRVRRGAEDLLSAKHKP